MEHIFLSHCWVCEVRFNTADPPGPANEERHHIIPRQAGGTDGPQVSLCDVHHTKLHKIALRLKSKKPYFEFLVGESDPRKQKLLWLASRVYNAFELTSGDPNKKVAVVLALDSKSQAMIDKLKKVYPNLRSREAILNLALTSLYNKHFLE
jgi:hypothetical protein